MDISNKVGTVFFFGSRDPEAIEKTEFLYEHYRRTFFFPDPIASLFRPAVVQRMPEPKKKDLVWAVYVTRSQSATTIPIIMNWAKEIGLALPETKTSTETMWENVDGELIPSFTWVVQEVFFNSATLSDFWVFSPPTPMST